MTRLRHQVRIADIVILNKSDLVGSDNEALRNRVKLLNPFANVWEASYCDISVHDLMTITLNKPIATQITADIAHPESDGRPNLGAKAIRTTRQASEIHFKDIVGQLAEYLYRIKGYVHVDNGEVLAVQVSFGRIEFCKVKNYNGPSELILMGPDLETHAALYRSIFD
jgi:G3E family GTPase